jgi:hypothetical protein
VVVARVLGKSETKSGQRWYHSRRAEGGIQDIGRHGFGHDTLDASRWTRRSRGGFSRFHVHSEHTFGISDCACYPFDTPAPSRPDYRSARCDFCVWKLIEFEFEFFVIVGCLVAVCLAESQSGSHTPEEDEMSRLRS